MFKHDICIIGGCGRVGLPLAIAFADRGKNVVIYDLDKSRMDKVRKGIMPFLEEEAEEILRQVLQRGHLKLSADPSVISEADTVIVTIGTPVNEHLNPEFEAVQKAIDCYMEFLGMAHVIPDFLYKAITKQVPFEIFGDGGQLRTFPHVKDVAEAVRTIYNAGYGGKLEVFPRVNYDDLF